MKTFDALERWLKPGRFALVLVGLIALAYPDVLFLGRSFVIRDFGYFGYPLAHYHRESFWRGEVPLWNPLSSNGLPFLAQWNTLVLYPGSLIYLLLPLPWSLSVFCLSHMFLAGLGMYFLAHHWTGHRLASAAAGLLFASNGLTSNCLMWPNNIAALGWMPWVVLATSRARGEGGKWILLASLVGAMQMLAGAPEIILLTWSVASLFCLAEMAQAVLRNQRSSSHPDPEPASKTSAPPSPNVAPVPTRAIFPGPSVVLGRFALVVLLVGALSAAQLLPFLDLVTHWDRTQQSWGALWSMPRWGWVNLVLPLFRSYQSPVGVFFQPGQDWTSSYYPGIGAVALAAVAALGCRSRRVWLLLGITALGLLLALGDAGGLYLWLRAIIHPFNQMRYPIKFVVLPIFGFPLLAAFAVRDWTTAPSPAATTRWLVLGASVGVMLTGLIAFVLVRYPQTVPHGVNLPSHAAGRLVLLAGILGSAAACSRARSLRMHILTGGALLALLWIDLQTHTPRQNPTVASSVCLPGMLPGAHKMDPLPRLGQSCAFVERPAHDQIYASMLSDPENDFLCHRLWLFGNVNLLDGIPLVDSFYSLYLPHQRAVWAALFFANTNQDLSGLQTMLGISQVTSRTKTFEWTPRPRFSPWVTAGQAPVFADDAATLAGLTSPSFDPRHTVYLPLEAKGAITTSREAQVSVEATTLTAHRVEVKVNAKEPSILVATQAYYHRWKAEVNGKPVPLWRANRGFQAVELPAGISHVTLVYRDPAFTLGAVISLATLAALAAAAWRAARLIPHTGR